MHPKLTALLLTIIDVLELPHVTTLPYSIIFDPQTIPMISNVWAKKNLTVLQKKTCRPDAPMGAAKRGPGCSAFTSGGNGEPRATS